MVHHTEIWPTHSSGLDGPYPESLKKKKQYSVAWKKRPEKNVLFVTIACTNLLGGKNPLVFSPLLTDVNLSKMY